MNWRISHFECTTCVSIDIFNDSTGKILTWDNMNMKWINTCLCLKYMKMMIHDIWKYEMIIYEHGICLINMFIHDYRFVHLECITRVTLTFQMIQWAKFRHEIIWTRDELSWKCTWNKIKYHFTWSVYFGNTS